MWKVGSKSAGRTTQKSRVYVFTEALTVDCNGRDAGLGRPVLDLDLPDGLGSLSDKPCIVLRYLLFVFLRPFLLLTYCTSIMEQHRYHAGHGRTVALGKSALDLILLFSRHEPSMGEARTLTSGVTTCAE